MVWLLVLGAASEAGFKLDFLPGRAFIPGRAFKGQVAVHRQCMMHRAALFIAFPTKYYPPYA